MKFGLNHHRHIIPEWTEHYIPYNSLKFLIKHRPSDLNNIQSTFVQKVQAVTSFVWSHVNIIEERQASHRDNNHHASEENGTAGTTEEMISIDVGKLQSFYRVNEEAGDRLLARLKRFATDEELASARDVWGMYRAMACLLKARRTSAVFSATAIAPYAGEYSAPKGENKSSLGRLYMAVMLEKEEMVSESLLKDTADVGTVFGDGLTVLHVAAQKGHVAIATKLIQAGADVDAVSQPSGRTPIFEAALRGHIDFVRKLIEAGAKTTLTDNSGWTPKEIATYRGHMEVAEMLHALDDGQHSLSLPSRHMPSSITSDRPEDSEHVQVVVHLGSMQRGRDTPFLQLQTYSSEGDAAVIREKSMNALLVVEGGSDKYRIKLPVLDDPHDAPLIFSCPKDRDLRLVFKLYGTDPEGNDELICGGTALLEGNKLLFGSHRQGLIREHTVSVLQPTTLDIVGSILFTYVIVRPFPHLKSPVYDLKAAVAGGMMLVGHRGSGQNVSAKEYLQIGENSVESFLAAAGAGASFVEFDVQLTRDHVPVIYHNFSLSESGTDIPIHDLTLDQFRHMSSSQKPRQTPKPRSRSLDTSEDPNLLQMTNRLANTAYFKTNGFISNTRGGFIQEPFSTLRECFQKLPDSVGFNVELKYPRLHEAKNTGLAPIALDLNLYVDTILEQVHQHAGNRPIILSSFTPEVCILLSRKQQAYPVMLITNAGKLPMIDFERRAASLQVAVRFARRWGLTGLVLACEPFVLSPRLVGLVKKFGLVCASYGQRNSVPKDLEIQARAGLDIMIVDRVKLVANTLRELKPKTSKE